MEETGQSRGLQTHDKTEHGIKNYIFFQHKKETPIKGCTGQVQNKWNFFIEWMAIYGIL